MKVIFLDIDGVLNSGDDMRSRHKLHSIEKNQTIITDDHFEHHFDERCVRWLDFIIRSTGAKIVVSSTWRHRGLEFMQQLWQERKLPGDVIAITPKLGAERGEEIKAWLDENDYVERFVIIDDDSDMLFEQQQNFVKCAFDFGLTMSGADKAVQILNQ